MGERIYLYHYCVAIKDNTKHITGTVESSIEINSNKEYEELKDGLLEHLKDHNPSGIMFLSRLN